MSDVQIAETAVEEAPPTAATSAPEGPALDLLRDGLAERTRGPEAAPEPVAPALSPEEGSRLSASSRRARTVERVKTEAEQRIEAAEARAVEAEQRARQLEEGRTSEQEAERLAQLGAEYNDWIGTAEQYAEAQRLSRLDPDDPSWDWDRHRQAVTNLETWDARRKWAGLVGAAAETKQQRQIEHDFLVTLSADLPEAAREAYRTHKGGIPGAVRFYAETMMQAKVEELEGVIAERDAEIGRLTASGGRYRAPAPGGPSTSNGSVPLDYARSSPEELMSAGLREQQRGAGRRR